MVGRVEGVAKYQREWKRTMCVYFVVGVFDAWVDKGEDEGRLERYVEGEAWIQVIRGPRGEAERWA